MPDTDFSTWTRFDECFDASGGGCLYLRYAPDASDDILAAGALWLDGGQDGLRYYACVARFTIGEERYGDTDVNEIFDAAEAFDECLDSEIEESIGWFSTLEEAAQAVDDAIETYLA